VLGRWGHSPTHLLSRGASAICANFQERRPLIVDASSATKPTCSPTKDPFPYHPLSLMEEGHGEREVVSGCLYPLPGAGEGRLRGERGASPYAARPPSVSPAAGGRLKGSLSTPVSTGHSATTLL